MRRSGILLFTALLAWACGEETPTDVGGSLLPDQSVRTFEVILEPAAYLVKDTSFSGYLKPSDVAYLVVANAFEGALNARSLARFQIPSTISVTDSAGTLRTDTLPGYFAGQLVVRLDTLRGSAAPANLTAFQATESWDRASASWTLRMDTAGVRTPWSTPGGSPGAFLDSASWEAGSDTVVLRLDSTTVAMWRDTANVVPGIVLAAGSNGARLRISDVTLRVDARTTVRRDTVVTTTVGPTGTVFIFDPPVEGTSSQPRSGGLPGWRSILQVREGLDTLSVACPDGAAGCRFQLSETSITYAALVLQPQLSPPGFSPEDSVALGTRLVLVSSLAPLERSPLGPIVGVMPRGIARSHFLDPASPPIEVPITEFMRAMAADSSEVSERPSAYIGILPLVDGSTFGFPSFDPAPRLRLILTVARELQLR